MSFGMKNAILFGATSEIGIAIIDELCAPPDWFIVRAGSPKAASGEAVMVDLQIDWERMEPIEQSSEFSKLNIKFDLVVISLGYLPATNLQFNSHEILKNSNANLIWPLLCLDFLVKNSLLSKDAIIVILSSSLVALPVTRKSLVYTNLKSTLEKTINDGIHYGFFPNNVIFLRPGYVLTKINSHLPPGKFPTTAQIVAKTLANKIRKGCVRGVIYAPTQVGVMAVFTKIFPHRIRRWALSKAQNSD